MVLHRPVELAEIIGIWELVFFPDSRSGLHGAGTLGARAASALRRFLASLASFSWSILLERMDTTKRP